MKKIFYLINIIGIIVIILLSLLLPNNPFKIVPTIFIHGIDKPLWLCYSITGIILYTTIIWIIYFIVSKKVWVSSHYILLFILYNPFNNIIPIKINNK